MEALRIEAAVEGTNSHILTAPSGGDQHRPVVPSICLRM